MEKKTKWIISQKWEDLVFLNYQVNYEELRSIVPSYLELDSFDGNFYTSVVPFKMSRVRFPFTPTLPFSKLNELNLRTYVTYKGQRGIYFFTLDSNHRLANFIARKFFNLPYRNSNISLHVKNNQYHAQSSDLDLNLFILDKKVKSPLENFLVERYFLFTDNGKDIFRGQVFHRPWEIKNIKTLKVEENLNKKYGFNDFTFANGFYSEGFDVYFKPFQKVD
jgi:uncharacterized protein YqjF (DUF2071 family)